ncbi:MAG: 4-hydroxy-tetrahydrodipicolinate synthase [Candidatus Electryoneaceae bacterium]|nr:4-hydroxy-tetrahydrodipicolinate synthase [Candidatus Electryoneaceae bacterium]
MIIQGVYTALVTPFRRNGVDTGKTTELVMKAKEAGISGVVPLGSTGESSAMEDSERAEVISTVVKASSGKLSVIVGAGTNNTLHTSSNIHRAADLGADAVLIVAPYYNKPTYEGLRRHFSIVANDSPLPIILYHIPSRCGVGIPLELVLELSQHPNIVGIKEAGGDGWRSAEIARRTPAGFSMLSGDDGLTLPLLSVGAKGVIAVVSNIAPKMTRTMVDSAITGNYKKALDMHRTLAPLIGALSLETNPSPIKEAMNLIGMEVGDVRLPLVPVQEVNRVKIRAVLDQMEIVE